MCQSCARAAEELATATYAQTEAKIACDLEALRAYHTAKQEFQNRQVSCRCFLLHCVVLHAFSTLRPCSSFRIDPRKFFE